RAYGAANLRGEGYRLCRLQRSGEHHSGGDVAPPNRCEIGGGQDCTWLLLRRIASVGASSAGGEENCGGEQQHGGGADPREVRGHVLDSGVGVSGPRQLDRLRLEQRLIPSSMTRVISLRLSSNSAMRRLTTGLWSVPAFPHSWRSE